MKKNDMIKSDISLSYEWDGWHQILKVSGIIASVEALEFISDLTSSLSDDMLKEYPE